MDEGFLTKIFKIITLPSLPKESIFLLVFFFTLNLIFPQTLSQTQSGDAVKKKIEIQGKLSFKKDIPLLLGNKASIRQYIVRWFEENYPKILSEKETISLYLLGFTDKKTDIRPLRKDYFINNTSAWYNEKKQELLAPEEYREMDSIHAMGLAHELRHVIQSQYFGFSNASWFGNTSDFDDRKFALLAAIEGDAVFAMLQFSEMDIDILTSTTDADALLSFSHVISPSLLHGEAPILKYQAVMTYVEGLRFVNAVFNKKKWKGVNKILSSPPDSTEQILHPEKYLKREKPMTVTLRFIPGNHTLVHSGVIGEYNLNILLNPNKDGNTYDYAKGWGGDAFYVYRYLPGKDNPPADASLFLLWGSLWDDPTDCSRFFTDFTHFVEKRFNVNFKTGSVGGNNFIAGRSTGSENYFFLMKSNNKMLYVRSDNRIQMNTFIKGGKYD